MEKIIKIAQYRAARLCLQRVKRRHAEAACDFLAAQAAYTHHHDEPETLSDPLDGAAHDLELARRGYCAALYSYHCATAVVHHSREAFRTAQERLDTLAFGETRKEAVVGRPLLKGDVNQDSRRVQ